MSDPRLPLEEDTDLGEIEEVEAGEGDDPDAEDGEDAVDAQGGDEEAEGDAEEDGPRRDVRQPSRRESRIARTTRENAELRERLANLEGQVSARQNQPQPAADPYAAQRAQEAERQYLDTLTPTEALLYVQQRGQQQFGQALQAIRVEGLDRSDKMAFESRAERSQARQQLAAEVEKTAQNLLRQGQIANREDIFAYLFGKEALRKAERGQSPRARQGAQRRVAAQTTRPGSGRGDVARGGNRQRSQEDDDRRLLERTTVGDVI